MFVFMVTGDREESARNARRRLIIVGWMAQPRRRGPPSGPYEKPSFGMMTVAHTKIESMPCWSRP